MLRERGVKERNINQLPYVCLNQGSSHKGMCSDKNLNWQTFGAQDDAQPNEPLWLGKDLPRF